MALPTVKINNSTGSNTAASGAGPGDGVASGSAVTGTAAAHTSGSATTTITLTNSPNLSGIATDGSAVVYLATSSGRKFSMITAVDNVGKSLTVQDPFTITVGGAVNYAVGGKRLNFETTNSHTKQLFLDAKAGWTVDLQQTGTDYVLTSALVITVVASAALPFTFTSTSGTRPLLTTATNSINLIDITGSSFLAFANLSLSNTAGTKGTTSANGRGVTPVGGAAFRVSFENCIWDGFEIALDVDNVNYFVAQYVKLVGCEIKNSVLDGVRTSYDLSLDHCFIHGNGGHGVTNANSNSGGGPTSLSNCTFASNTGSGYRNQYTGAAGVAVQLHLVQNTFRLNGAAGVKLDFSAGSGSSGPGITHAGNLYYGQTTYGVDLTNASEWVVLANRNNAYGSNTSGARNNFPAGANDVALSADPFVSSTDYGLNATAGGGAACKGATLAAPNVSANTAGDIGAVPSGGGAAAAAGGVSLARVAGGM